MTNVVMVSVSSILTLQLIIKINNMFKVKQNDIFAKNMNKAELYQVWKQLKAKQEMDKFLNKLIAKNGTTNY